MTGYCIFFGGLVWFFVGLGCLLSGSLIFKRFWFQIGPGRGLDFFFHLWGCLFVRGGINGFRLQGAILAATRGIAKTTGLGVLVNCFGSIDTIFCSFGSFGNFK